MTSHSQWITNLAESKVQLRVKPGASKNKVTARIMHGKVTDEDATFIEVLRAVHAVWRMEGGREGGREGGIRERNWKKMYTVLYDLLQTWAKEVSKIKS